MVGREVFELENDPGTKEPFLHGVLYVHIHVLYVKLFPSAATPATFETPLSGRTTAGKHPHPHQAAGCSTDSMATDGAPDPKKKPEDYSLDRFLAKYESEDDASFAEIMVKTKEEHRAKHAWLYEKEKEYMQSVEAPEQLLAITDGSEDGGRDKKLPERSGVKSWTYTVKNTLMYIPDGLERSTLEKVSDPSKKREVVHSNTRLSSAFVHKMHSALKGTGEGEAKGSKDKVGIDGKVLDPSSSPQVNGYGFVATPQIQPGTCTYVCSSDSTVYMYVQWSEVL